MKPYEKRTAFGKFLARTFGYANREMGAAEIAVRVVDFIKMLVERPEVSAYTAASKSKLDDRVIAALKSWLPKVSSALGIHAQRGDDWQAAAQGTADGLRAMKLQERPGYYREISGLGFQAELTTRGERVPTLDVAKMGSERQYQEMKAAGQIS